MISTGDPISNNPDLPTSSKFEAEPNDDQPSGAPPIEQQEQPTKEAEIVMSDAEQFTDDVLQDVPPSPQPPGPKSSNHGRDGVATSVDSLFISMVLA